MADTGYNPILYLFITFYPLIRSNSSMQPHIISRISLNILWYLNTQCPVYFPGFLSAASLNWIQCPDLLLGFCKEKRRRIGRSQIAILTFFLTVR